MKTNEYCVGLDIGTTKIVAMVGRKDEYGKIEILGVGHAKSQGVRGGTVNNIVQTTQSIQRAIDLAKEASGLEIDRVEVGIAGQHIRSIPHIDYIIRNNPDEIITDADIEELKVNTHKLQVRAGEEIIHILPQEFRVDGQEEIQDPRGMVGGRLEGVFHVVLGQKSSIRNIERCVKDAGLSLCGMPVLESMASAISVLSDEEKEAGVALVDIGGGTTDLAIFKNGIIRHTSVITMGGNIITEDIKEGCSIIEKNAEQLKIQYGSAWPEENSENSVVSIPGLRGREPKEISLKNLSTIIHARMKEIIEAVFNEIKKYGYDEQKKKLIGGIVLTGGGSKMKHLEHLVEAITGLDTRIGYPNEHLAGDTDTQICSPVYATSIGLLMGAIENQSTKRLSTPYFEHTKQPVFEPVEEVLPNDQQKKQEQELEQQELPAEEHSQKADKKEKGFLQKVAGFFDNFMDKSE